MTISLYGLKLLEYKLFQTVRDLVACSYHFICKPYLSFQVFQMFVYGGVYRQSRESDITGYLRRMQIRKSPPCELKHSGKATVLHYHSSFLSSSCSPYARRMSPPKRLDRRCQPPRCSATASSNSPRFLQICQGGQGGQPVWLVC